MTPEKADRLMVFTYENFKAGGASGAQDPVEDSGEVLERTCRGCDAPVNFATFDGSDWTCRRCNSDWVVTTEYRFVGEVRMAPRKGAYDDRMAKQFDLRNQFEEFINDPKMLWPARIYVANCLEYSIRELVAIAPETWGEDAPATMWGVRKNIEAGRSEWSRRLATLKIK